MHNDQGLDAQCNTNGGANEDSAGDANCDGLYGRVARAAGNDTGWHSVGIDAAACEARSDVLQPGRGSGGGGVGGDGRDGVCQHQTEGGVSGTEAGGNGDDWTKDEGRGVMPTRG